MPCPQPGQAARGSALHPTQLGALPRAQKLRVARAGLACGAHGGPQGRGRRAARCMGAGDGASGSFLLLPAAETPRPGGRRDAPLCSPTASRPPRLTRRRQLPPRPPRRPPKWGGHRPARHRGPRGVCGCVLDTPAGSSPETPSPGAAPAASPPGTPPEAARPPSRKEGSARMVPAALGLPVLVRPSSVIRSWTKPAGHRSGRGPAAAQPTPTPAAHPGQTAEPAPAAGTRLLTFGRRPCPSVCHTQTRSKTLQERRSVVTCVSYSDRRAVHGMARQ